MRRPLLASSASAAEDPKMLCDKDCTVTLEGKEMMTTKSGLQYKDLVVGTGPIPKVGYQVQSSCTLLINV